MKTERVVKDAPYAARNDMPNSGLGFARIDARAPRSGTIRFTRLRSRPALAADEIHVYSFDLDSPRWRADAVLELLAPDEVARADRYRVPDHGRRFLAARAALREILAAYARVEARDVSFVYGDYGKPFLDRGSELGRIRFNSSRSSRWGLVAIRRDEDVGVDVERIRPFPKSLEIARRFFSEFEWHALQLAPDAERDRRFFEYWTRKEAIVKSLGKGLSHPLSAFTVSSASCEIVDVADHDIDGSPAGRLTVWALRPSPGYVAALATRCLARP